MEFCPKCEKKLIETTNGIKCPKCDNLSKFSKKSTTNNNIGILSYDSFPFEINQYYKAKDIRNYLNCDKQSGINYNKKYNFLTLIRYAHKLKPNPSNPYLDYFDTESGNYYYVGKGTIGNQSSNGVNGILKNANENRTTIHLFWQHNVNSDHEYIGRMKMKNYE